MSTYDDWKTRSPDDGLPGDPEQWVEREVCGGEGMTVHRVTVYEHGCGFPHDDTDERLCVECNGCGGRFEGVAPDDNYEPPDPPGWEGGFSENH